MEAVESYIPILFLAIGYGGLAYSLLSLSKSIRAKRWERVRADIITSTIDTSCDNEGCIHEAKIKYKYTINGQSYSSSKIAFGYLANSINYFANKINKKYTPGSTAFIYINPRNPERSVLLAGIRPFHIFNIIFFIIFTAISNSAYTNFF